MSTELTTDWAATLDRMTAAVDRTLAELNEYQKTWASVIESPAAVTPPELLLAWLERRLDQWDAQLTAAGELAASVEQQLADREASMSRWQEVLLGWKEFIQQNTSDIPHVRGEPCPVTSQ
jgi:hypothetical protein